MSTEFSTSRYMSKFSRRTEVRSARQVLVDLLNLVAQLNERRSSCSHARLHACPAHAYSRRSCKRPRRNANGRAPEERRSAAELLLTAPPRRRGGAAARPGRRRRRRDKRSGAAKAPEVHRRPRVPRRRRPGERCSTERTWATPSPTPPGGGTLSSATRSAMRRQSCSHLSCTRDCRLRGRRAGWTW